MGVPAELAHAAVVERDERDARLDQPAGQQARLAERGAAVPVADVGGLVVDLERRLGGARGEQVVRLVGELVAAAASAGSAARRARTVERLDHPAAAAEPVERQPVGRRQVADPEARLVRVAADGERVVGRGQVAARREDRRVGHGHVGRQAPALVLAGLGDDAAVAGIDQRRARADSRSAGGARRGRGRPRARSCSGSA